MWVFSKNSLNFFSYFHFHFHFHSPNMSTDDASIDPQLESGYTVAKDFADDEDIVIISEGSCTTLSSPLPSSDTAGSSCIKRPSTDALVNMIDFKSKGAVDLAIARFFFACGIPFDAGRSPYFKRMVRALNDGIPGYRTPSYERLRTVLADKEKVRIEKIMAPLKVSWSVDGCSIVMVGWKDTGNRSLLNIIVSSTSGPYLLRAIVCSEKNKNAVFLKDQLCEAIDEVGPSNVVQVITDTTPVCKAAGLMVQNQYTHIFWMPCYVHALKDALKDICKTTWIAELIKNGQKIQMFICNHDQLHAIFQKLAKVELLKPSATRFVSYYILLQQLWEAKGALCTTVISDTGASLMQSSSDIAIEVRRKILDDNFWNDVKFVVDFLEPLCDTIRCADTGKRCLGEVYESINRVSERIKFITDKRDPSLYPQLEQCIHGQWNELNTPLLMASYASNPKRDVDETRPPFNNMRVMQGFVTAVSMIYCTEEEASKIRRQFAGFLGENGEFRTREAKYNRCNGMAPIDWWSLHGRHVPEVQRFAIRLLSQVASSSAYERNCTYDVIHSTKRNRLESEKEEDLTYIHSALQLLYQNDVGYQKGPSKKWN